MYRYCTEVASSDRNPTLRGWPETRPAIEKDNDGDHIVRRLGCCCSRKWGFQGRLCHARRTCPFSLAAAGTSAQGERRITSRFHRKKSTPWVNIVVRTGECRLCYEFVRRKCDESFSSICLMLFPRSLQEAVKHATEQLRLLGVQPGDIVSLAFTNTLEVRTAIGSALNLASRIEFPAGGGNDGSITCSPESVGTVSSSFTRTLLVMPELYYHDQIQDILISSAEDLQFSGNFSLPFSHQDPRTRHFVGD